MATQPTQTQRGKPTVPTQQVPVKPAVAAVQGAAKKPGKPKRKFPNLDWLFILAVLFVLGQIGLLFILHNTKEAYRALKQEDADRIYVLQKASTVSQEDVNLLEQSFLREDDIITFIQSLESARDVFGDFSFRFTSDTPQGKENQYLPFEIVAVGTKDTIRLFIEKLLSSTYAIEATKIDITTAEDDPGHGQMNMTGNVYIQVLKK